jgi:hypothetical protein
MRMSPARLRASAALPAAAITAAALLAAGCGGGGSGGATPGAGTGPAGPTVQKMDSFAACMRSHGEPNFYVAGNGGVTASPSVNTPAVTIGGWWFTGTNPRSAQFQSAMKSCQHVLPIKPPSQATQHKQFVQALRSAACMRSHGYTTWADPKMSGQGVMIPAPPAGVNTSTPHYQKDAKTCGVAGP